MRCDIIAEGIVEAVNEMKLDKPLIVRLEGTNVERGKEMNYALAWKDLMSSSLDLFDGSFLTKLLNCFCITFF